jgi:type I restriction enzyme R subunit
VSAEQAARQTIDKLLAQAGWAVQDFKQADIHAARGVAIREFVLNEGHGFADYLLYIDDKAAGVIEAKKEGATLTGVEIQSARYAQGVPAALPPWRRPLPFVSQPRDLKRVTPDAKAQDHSVIVDCVGVSERFER